MPNTLTYAALTNALPNIGFDQEAAEYHGALCGALCVKTPAEVDPLAVLDRVDPAADDFEAIAFVRGLRDSVAAVLADADSGIALLLPEDEVSLVLRARALGTWCEGFLFGLASLPGLNLKQATAEVQEIVADITEFTRATYADGDGDAEIEEEAYAELVEYVRVGLQLIFMELAPRARPAANDQTVH